VEEEKLLCLKQEAWNDIPMSTKQDHGRGCSWMMGGRMQTEGGEGTKWAKLRVFLAISSEPWAEPGGRPCSPGISHLLGSLALLEAAALRSCNYPQLGVQSEPQCSPGLWLP
jgi:hypothetical protein